MLKTNGNKSLSALIFHKSVEVGEGNHPYHDVSFPFGKTQIGIKPVHQSLYLIPIEEDEEDKKKEVEHAKT